jgi:hypothetical protein
MAKVKDKPLDVEIVGKSDAPTQALVLSPRTELALTREPTEILADAKKAADALMTVINAKKDKVMMNGKQYLVYEDWQTVGTFFNLVPRIREDKLIQIDMGRGKITTGYEAFAEVINTKTGIVITSATAMCLNDEEKWSSRNKFEYHYVLRSGGTSKDDPGSANIIWEPHPDKPGKNRPKKVRVDAGEVSVPLFQLRSMAQTRACAKAMRNAMAWVVVLAGFQPTPAEELEEVHHGRAHEEAPDPDWIPPEDAPPVDPLKQKSADPEKPKVRKKAAKAEPEPEPPETAKPEPPPPPPAPVPPANGTAKAPPKITESQRRRLFAFVNEFKWSEKQVKAMLQKELGTESTTEIPQGAKFYDRVIGLLEKGPKAYGA